jgi:hypothetical protein
MIPCINEAHVFVEDHNYHPMSESEVFNGVKENISNTSILFMTATYLDKTRDILQNMYEIIFKEQICEQMQRHHLLLHLKVKPNSAEWMKHIKKLVKEQFNHHFLQSQEYKQKESKIEKTRKFWCLS